MSFWDKIFNRKNNNTYDTGLTKSRNLITSSLNNLNKQYKFIDENYLEELESILVMADVGVNTVITFMDNLKKRIRKENISDPEDLKEIIVDELFLLYASGDILSSTLNKSIDDELNVYLFIGVNGVGKTTTIAKMAKQLKEKGERCLLIAADTFRAGAREQLINWGQKIACQTFTTESSDPSAVIYAGLNYAKENSFTTVLIDTAGRLENKQNLMNELGKINQVIKKIIPSAPHETLLVLDATTGQNGINQAKSFSEVTNVTGIILTKLDGTAKGGIVLAIKNELNLAVKYVGLGEKETDLVAFDIEEYIYSLFKDLKGND